MWVHVVGREAGGSGDSRVGLAPVIPIPSPHSYIETQQHLQQLMLSDLRGLGELRKL